MLATLTKQVINNESITTTDTSAKELRKFVSEWGLLSSCGMHTSHCSGFFCCRAWALEFSGFSSCSTLAQQLWLLSSRVQVQ